MPTTNAVPSADPSDLLFNAQKLDEVINGSADSFFDRRGVERLTLTGALRLIGFEAPVAFTTGLSITRSTQTVTNSGNTYHADPASLPFTTTGTFNGAQWRLVSNVTSFDLAAYAVPLVGGAGTVEMAKLTTPVQNLINGALQKSGGTMLADILLPGNTSQALGAVPKQQAEALVSDSAAVSSALSFSSLALSATGLSANVSVSAGELLLRPTTGAPRLVSGVSLTINTAATGANGLDTGTLAGSTWYAVWVINNGTTTASLLSLSPTAPTMPSGYTHKARVGWIRTDGTVNKYPLAFVQRARRAQYVLAGALTAFPQMFYGTTSSVQAVATGAVCPTTAGAIALSWGVAGSGSGASIAIGPSAAATNTSSSGFAYLGASSTSFSATNNCLMILESSSIYVSSSNANGFVGCTGWEDNL